MLEKKTFPKTFVFGANSFIGAHLYKLYQKSHANVQGTSRRKQPSALLPFDLKSSTLSSLNVDWESYQHAILCFGETKLSQCESQKEDSYQVNVHAILSLVEELHRKKIKPILFSTDLVLDGQAPQCDENTPCHPLNEYGRQKLILEKEVPKICGRDFLILRLSKVYNSSCVDDSLLFEIIQKFINKEPLKAADDYFFCPLALSDLVLAIEMLQKENLSGLYNLAGEEFVSWYEICSIIAETFNFPLSQVERIKINRLKTSIKRPEKVNLVPRRFKNHFPKFQFSTLKEHLKLIKEKHLVVI